MSGFIIDDVAIEIPGIVARSWRDDVRMRLERPDRRPRITRWVRSIILHGTNGDWPQIVHPGEGPVGMALRTTNAWRSDTRHAGSHLIIDGDGSVWCLADLVREVSYHAKSINEVSIGIELAQSRQVELWQAQLDAAVRVCDALTRLLGIQRQVHTPYRPHPVDRLARGGVDCVGIFGHRDQSSNRGRGDPGDAVFDELRRAGYEAFDFALETDKVAWKERQQGLGLGQDGVPGARTLAKLKQAGYAHGMWVKRPGDEP